MGHGLPEGKVVEAKKDMYAAIWRYGACAIRGEGIGGAIAEIEDAVDSFENIIDMEAYYKGKQVGFIEGGYQQ